MEKNKNPQVVRAAIIGLIGTVLTVCGGLAGIGIRAAITIYQTRQEAQHVALAAAASDQTLSIDTDSIFISRQQAASLDPETFFIDLDQGLALHRPLPGWSDLEEMTVAEQLSEMGGQSTDGSSLNDQPVYVIRYGDPIQIESNEHTRINGHELPAETLAILTRIYGPPPWTQPHYSQVTVNVFDRAVAEELHIETLPDLLVVMTASSVGHFNRLTAEDGSNFMVLQSSSTYEQVKMNGAAATFTLENWLLLAKAQDAYYTVETIYTPQSGQSVQVWEDLQTYMDAFRVVQ